MDKKTSEIYQTLRAVRTKPFGKKDIVYAKEHQRDSSARSDLINLSTNRIDILEGAGIIEKDHTDEVRLTSYGIFVLREFEDHRKKYGASKVEIVPVNRNGKITYGVRVNPRVKESVQASQPVSENSARDTQTMQGYEPHFSEDERIKVFVLAEKLQKEYETRKEDVTRTFNELKAKNRLLKRLREVADFLEIETEIPFYRTLEEVTALRYLAEDLGVKMNIHDNETERNYSFSSSGMTPLILTSKKSGKGLQACRPLEIKIDLHQSTDSTPALIKAIVEKFDRKR